MIDLSFNQLQQIDKETLKCPVNLTHIWLNNNQLQQIDKQTFNSLINLKEIYMSNNRLKQIDKDTFKSLCKLKTIELHNNKFKDDTELELNLEDSVEFASFRSGQVWLKVTNDLSLIKKVLKLVKFCIIFKRIIRLPIILCDQIRVRIVIMVSFEFLNLFRD